MYLVCMDESASEDIIAAAAAHQELGPHFDGAVAESLVERIGAEIDKRVDARLGGRGIQPVRRSGGLQLSQVQHSWSTVVLALGSMGIGIGATAAILSMNQTVATDGTISNQTSSGQLGLVVLIWIVIGIINVSYARRR
jgi:hypothetical protein